MKILEIRNIHSDEDYIYYRRSFSAIAVIELPVNTVDVRINFIIEMLPTGKKEVDIELVDDVEYPIFPLKKALTEMVLKLDYEGCLP